MWVGYVAALRTGCMLAIISGPESPSAVQASHASARKPRYSGLCTLARGPCPNSNRLDQIVLARLEPREQPVGAFGLLGGSLDDAANQKELRIVASMQFGIDGLHADAPWVKTESQGASVALHGFRVSPRDQPKRLSYLVIASSVASMSGLRPDSRSASTRPEPHAMVQPSVP